MGTIINNSVGLSTPVFPYSGAGSIAIPDRQYMATTNFLSKTLIVTNVNSSGDGSLNKCLDYANQTDQIDYIKYNIPGIAPQSVPVAVNSYYPIEMDGTTQNANGYLGSLPKIILTGTNFNSCGNNSKYLGLTFSVYFYIFKFNNISASKSVTIGESGKSNLFKNGLWIQGTLNTTFSYNYYGIDNTSTLTGSSTFEASSCKGLIISHNSICEQFVFVKDSNTSIYDNRFGTNVAGTSALTSTNISIEDCKLTIIGGLSAGYGNVIVGAIDIQSNDVSVINNNIGVDLTGMNDIGRGIVSVGHPLPSPAPKYLNILIQGNTISGGIDFLAARKATVIKNKIGVSLDGINVFNVGRYGGITVNELCDSLEIGRVTSGDGNLIAGDTSAVYLFNNVSPGARRISIRGNSFFGNIYKGIILSNNANEGIQKPAISNLTANSISGTCLPNSFVDIYYNNTENCIAQGKIYIASVSSDISGNWTYTYSSDFNTTSSIVVTVTSPEGNTSEFSEYFSPYAGTDKSICKGVQMQIGSTAIAGYSYLWTPSVGLNNNTISAPFATVTNNSKFIVTVTNQSNCSQNDTVFISTNDKPNLSIIGAPLTACNNNLIDLTTSFTDLNSTGGNVSYWQDTSATTTPLINPNAVQIGGTYYIKKDNNGCSDIKSILTIFNTCTDTKVAEIKNNIELYPNPTQNILYISSDEKITGYELINFSGQTIEKGTVFGKNEIDFSTIGKGVYWVLLKTENGVYSNKIIKY